MHKKEMRNWMFIISIFLLVACDEVAYLRNDEDPVLVLNAVLEAGCDSMRIELTETKGAYDQSPWQRFPEAEVRVYEEGELLGMAEYQPADSSFVLRQPVKAERTYRIEARVAGKGMVWGETQVPRSPERYDFEIDFQEDNGWDYAVADCRWQDRAEDTDYYWLGAEAIGVFSMSWKAVKDLETDSALPDPVNRVFSLTNNSAYAWGIRIPDVGMNGQILSISYRFLRETNRVRVCFWSLDKHYDAYLKSFHAHYYNAEPTEGEMPWAFYRVNVYSNVQGGTGLVGSYAVERKMR